MANPEHLAILEQEVEAWNAWRRENVTTVPNLKEADLSGADLTQANLSAADLSGADITQANLSAADLSGANLGRANLAHANMSSAALVGASLFEARLEGAILREADLVGANFTAVDLTEANLSRAYLTDANFVRADLRGADLSGAFLASTFFHYSALEDAEFAEAILMDTVFACVDLAGTRGLDRCKHEGPSSIDTMTLDISSPLPEGFLRGCGLSDRWIEHFQQPNGQLIQFYSCFISFTEADNEFAERLYNDLQGQGVRCWRWKEDARGGRSLMAEVDRAVRLHDKLLVVCSENSMRSGPVIREIERALQREDQLIPEGEEAEVLFPLRLDDAILNWEHARSADVRAKFVSDFRNWKDHDEYQRAFERLLRDLRLDD